MHPWLGVAHSDQPARQEPGNEATAESARLALLLRLAKSAKKFYALKDVKILFASGIQTWKWKW